MTYTERSRFLNHYFLFSYLVVLTLASGYLFKVDFVNTRTFLFAVGTYLSYCAVYLLPAFLITRLCHGLFCLGGKSSLGWKAAQAVAVLTTGLTAVFLYADFFIFRLYHFHLNGFVWNLVKTPGGIESLGGNNSSNLTFGLIIAGFFAVQAFLLWLTIKLRSNRRSAKPRKIYRFIAAFLLLLALGERGIYGVSHLQAHTPVLAAASTFPFYQPTTFRSLAKKLGYKVKRQSKLKMDLDALQPSYPLRPIDVQKPARPLNIVWLMAESLRADMLDPEIMPATWNFAHQAHRFNQHYSGGNGTRMGLFSAFYGIYGPYWFPFLEARRSPVIMDVLQQQGYQLDLHTSAKFSYPEFDKTIFAGVPDRFMHEVGDKPGWQRDRENVDQIIEFVKNRDRNRPFMTFMFFESPHARYYFPEECAIRKPYLEDFNYATMSVDKDIELIRNRYINSCNHLDTQLGRLLALLEQERLLEDTIVIITGDHGEEFMEKGFWGHNSKFTEEQTRVPLVLWIPGTGASKTDRMTSHLDIVATILPLLGVKNPAEDYSLGYDLLGTKQRDFSVIADWSRICYVGSQYKASFPLKAEGLARNSVTRKDDASVEEEGAFVSTHQDVMLRLMQDLSRFRRK